jgi:alpha-glucoside transport system substrate-binding protein
VYIASGEMPDIAIVNNPTDMQEYAASGVLVPLSDSVVDQLYSNYHPDWIEMGSYQDVPYGVFFQVATRSLVWYPKVAFENMRYEIPQSWEELSSLENQIISDGSIPWCVGIESGGATGWTASDWIEDIVIRTAGPDLYDRWVNHEIPFTHPAIAEAFEVLADIWFDPQLVYGGTESIPSTHFGEAVLPMFDDTIGCWLNRQGSFISFWLPSEIQDDLENQLGVFPFPAIEDQYGTPLIVTGGQYVAFSDRPEVMAFLEFLATGEATTPWIEAGNYFFPHWDQDISAYDSNLEFEQALLLQNATFLRWDASDLMPDSVRSAFWSELTNWLLGQDLDTTLENIEANWP